MAILEGMIRKMKGSAGDLTFKKVNGRTIVSEKATTVKNTRTMAQQKVRMKWANMIQMYKGIAPLLNYGFESKLVGVSDYNMFVKLNSQRTPVYLTKSLVAGGACVVAPYQLSQGSLPSIVITGEGAKAVTNISLGNLTIGDATTIAEFSNAVVQNNKEFEYGDQISFFHIQQKVNAATGIPYGYFKAEAVVLDKENNNLLLATVNKAGFKTVDGFLGHGDDEGDGAYCWIHSRNKNHKTLISTQALIDNNKLLASYTSVEAYEDAVASYGGSKEVFLSPSDGNASASAEGAGNGSGNDSGNGSSTPDSGKDNPSGGSGSTPGSSEGGSGSDTGGGVVSE